MGEQDKDTPAGLDPRSCLVCATLFSIAAACLNNLAAALCALALALCILPLAWKRRQYMLKGLLAANFFILFLWLVTPFTTMGDYVWQWGFIHVSREGLKLAILVTIKANALALVFLTLVTPLPPSAMGAALHSLRCPDKLTWLFLLMGRNIHILQTEWRRLWEAARLRGFRPANNAHTYKTLGSLLGLFLLRAVEKSRVLHEAMLLRGYNGTLPFCGESRFTRRDLVFFICCLASISLLLMLEYGYINVAF